MNRDANHAIQCPRDRDDIRLFGTLEIRIRDPKAIEIPCPAFQP